MLIYYCITVNVKHNFFWCPYHQLNCTSGTCDLKRNRLETVPFACFNLIIQKNVFLLSGVVLEC